MRRIKFSLVAKVIISIAVTEFMIMLIFGKLSVLKTASPLFIAFLDTFFLGVSVMFVIKFAFRPLRSMIKKMDEIKEGKLDVRLDVRSRDEVGVIARQINLMVEGLEISYKKITESEKMLNTITDGIDEEIMLTDKNFRVLWANKKIKELNHLSSKDIEGSFCYKITHHLDEPCKEPLDICPILDIESKEKSAVMHTHFDKEGNAFYVDVIAYPLLNERGQIERFIHISRDVTERMKMIKEIREAKDKLEEYNRKLEAMVEERTVKITRNLIELANTNDELKSTQSQLIQAGKMAAIGQLASGVAHEINNPLATILNSVQLIKFGIGQSKEVNINQLKDAVNMIEESVARCKKITDGLLGFSHLSTGEFRLVSLNAAIKRVLLFVEHEMNLEDIIVIKELQYDLPDIQGDFQSLQQVFLNIVTNAHWAIQQRTGAGKDGAIVIKTLHNNGDDFVAVSFSDNGIGMSKEQLNRIFEVFFTTKPAGKGTGLGLSIVYNIIKRHNGRIEVESEENKGTIIKIFFPLLSPDNIKREEADL